ncbi:hypothetical protein T4D_13486 [Trichinella pseudospiralis]|uniref:Tudor domain-containing protein n=1 Tax=Trichinella pseudospiralis TaxID=6337 RepID=A0A0V1FN65_TRIPS|nr:hypothetical protein T4D_13486 [Trichinella pseudospiralis]
MAKVNLSSAEYFELFARQYDSQTTLMNYIAFGKPLKEIHSFNVRMTNYGWPMKFNVNFSFFYKIQKDMEAQMEIVYKDMDKVPQFDDSIILQYDTVNLPVAVQYSGKMNRALLLKSTEDGAHVHFVDSGENYVFKWEIVRPLYKQFVEWPPLAFHCQLNGLKQSDMIENVVATLEKAMPPGREFYCEVINWNDMESILMDLYLGETDRVLIVNFYLAKYFARKRQQKANRMLARKKLQEEKARRRMLMGDDWDSSDEN